MNNLGAERGRSSVCLNDHTSDHRPTEHLVEAVFDTPCCGTLIFVTIARDCTDLSHVDWSAVSFNARQLV